MPRPVGIKDVAAAAGVSTTTVSHALNGKGRIAPATRRRVEEAAERLGYRPSAMARGLAGGRTGMLAMVVSGTVDIPVQVGDFDYFLRLMNGATLAALRHGYSLTLIQSQGDPEPLDGLPLDGAIVVDPIPSDPFVERFRARGIAVVTTGRQTDGPTDAAWVDNDHRAGTFQALDHLAERGGRRVALLSPRALASYALDAHDAYRAWCHDHGQEPIVADVADAPSETSGFIATLDLLESRTPPDAIYATLDRLALGAMLAADARGVEVPRDLLIAACTDSAAARRAEPSLTVLGLAPERIGHEALELLLEILEGRTPGERQRLVPSTLVARASTGG